jgi:hypothetical protein
LFVMVIESPLATSLKFGRNGLMRCKEKCSHCEVAVATETISRADELKSFGNEIASSSLDKSRDILAMTDFGIINNSFPEASVAHPRRRVGMYRLTWGRPGGLPPTILIPLLKQWGTQNNSTVSNNSLRGGPPIYRWATKQSVYDLTGT